MVGKGAAWWRDVVGRGCGVMEGCGGEGCGVVEGWDGERGGEGWRDVGGKGWRDVGGKGCGWEGVWHLERRSIPSSAPELRPIRKRM